MNKRSKALLIVLISIVVITFLSIPNQTETNNDAVLEDFEEEIINPENELDPLNENIGSNVLLIEVALKTEEVIEKVFNIFINLLKNLTERII